MQYRAGWDSSWKHYLVSQTDLYNLRFDTTNTEQNAEITQSATVQKLSCLHIALLYLR